MKKLMLAVGINEYPRSPLHGCVNDAKNWSSLLKESFSCDKMINFYNKDVTPKHFEESVLGLYKDAKAGDLIIVQYSGHGSQVPDKNGDEKDKLDECICLISEDGKDIDFYIDDRLGDLFKKCPKGVNLVWISDSCYSGTNTRALAFSDARPKFLVPTKEEIDRYLSEFSALAKRTPSFSEEEMGNISLTGCSDAETSLDITMNGQPCGAMSYFAIKCIKENPKATWNEFYKTLRKYLPSLTYNQTPQLEGKVVNKAKVLFT